MATNERGDEGRAGAAVKPTLQGAKVVQFPREWLGPREELVPFGPSATAEERRASDADFWGEDSAVLHDAVEAPAMPRRSARHDRRGLTAVGAAIAVVVIGTGSVLGNLVSSGSPDHHVSFAVMSIPPLAPAGVKPAVHHAKRAAAAAKAHRRATRARAKASQAATSPGSATSSTTSVSSNQPAPASSGGGSSPSGGSSQSGGAFTLGGP